VLFREGRRRPEAEIVGRSPYLQAVHVLAPATMIGEVATVTITGLSANGLYGEACQRTDDPNLPGGGGRSALARREGVR
jgi:hypothetical protein